MRRSTLPCGRAQVVEKFTAHYVFALGLSRFISCAHWLLQIIDGDSFLLQAIGSGLWPLMVLASELVQTFILADFWCARPLPARASARRPVITAVPVQTLEGRLHACM